MLSPKDLYSKQPLHLYTEQNPHGPTDNPRWHFGAVLKVRIKMACHDCHVAVSPQNGGNSPQNSACCFSRSVHELPPGTMVAPPADRLAHLNSQGEMACCGIST